ncbi:carboxymuconolactone decarboxylase family protein [Clostridium sp. LBM24168]
MKNVTKGFEKFINETDGVGPAFMSTIMKMAEVSSLDKKIHELAYISALVTARMYRGLPFHIEQAKQHGATRDEIKSAILLPMPIVGIQVADAMPYISEDKADGDKE